MEIKCPIKKQSFQSFLLFSFLPHWLGLCASTKVLCFICKGNYILVIIGNRAEDWDWEDGGEKRVSFL